MSNLTAGHIGQHKGNFEPQRKNSFTFEVDVPYAGGKQLIKLALSGAFLPEYETETFSVDFQNEQVAFAGKPKTVSEGTIKLKDYVDQNVRNAVLSWSFQVYNPENGVVGLAKDYKRDAYVVLYGPDGSNTRLWKLLGAFPKKVSTGGEISYSENDGIEIEMVLSYDKAIPLTGSGGSEDIGGAAFGAGGGISLDGISI